MATEFIEVLSNEDAEMILGSNFDPKCSYTIITLPERFVINKKNLETGDEEEVVLEDTPYTEEQEVIEEIVYPKEVVKDNRLLKLLYDLFIIITLILAVVFIYLTATGKMFDTISKVVDALARRIR